MRLYKGMITRKIFSNLTPFFILVNIILYILNKGEFT